MVEKVCEVKTLGAMAGVVAPELFIWMMNGILRDNRKKVRASVVEKGLLWYSK